MKSLKFIPLMVLMLSACTVGPDYQRPDLGKSIDYRTSVSAEQGGSLARLEWFDLFNDPYLKDLIQMAIVNNLDLKVALSRVEQAQARVAISRSAFGPEIRGSLSTTPAPGGDGNDATFNSGAMFAWELDIFGKIRRANESAQASLLATEEGSRAVMSALVVSVAEAWYTLLELDEEQRIIERTIASQESSLNVVRSLIESGVASSAEEQQAIAQLAATQAQLPKVRKNIIVTENALSMLLGQAPQSFAERPVMRDILANVEVEDISLGLPAEILDQRPDIRRAEQNLHAATAKIGVAVANRFPFPTIGVSGLFGRFAYDLGDIGSSSHSVNFSGWGPYVDLPIIDWGRADGNLKVAKASTQEALFHYKAIVLQALREVSDSMYTFETSEDIINSNRVYSVAAQKSLQLQKDRFSSGVVGYLDVLDSERQLLNAELGLARSELVKMVAFLDLYRALGGGWSDENLKIAKGMEQESK